MRNLEQGYGNWEEAYSQTADEKAWLFTPQELVSSTQKQLQRKVAINLHDGDDPDKINIISFPDFQSSVMYQLYQWKLLKMQTHLPQLSQLSRPE